MPVSTADSVPLTCIVVVSSSCSTWCFRTTDWSCLQLASWSCSLDRAPQTVRAFVEETIIRMLKPLSATHFQILLGCIGGAASRRKNDCFSQKTSLAGWAVERENFELFRSKLVGEERPPCDRAKRVDTFQTAVKQGHL